MPNRTYQLFAEAMAARRPALIDCELDIHAGTESGHLTNLNPRSALHAAH